MIRGIFLLVLFCSLPSNAGEMNKIVVAVSEAVVQHYGEDVVSYGDISHIDFSERKVEGCWMVITGFAKRAQGVDEVYVQFWTCLNRSTRGYLATFIDEILITL